jgi:hypothetical protein
MTEQSTIHPALRARAPQLADRVESAIDLLTRVNGEPNYSAEKLGKAWALIAGELLALGEHSGDLHDRLDRIAGSRS